jgi:hypothetical protein
MSDEQKVFVSYMAMNTILTDLLNPMRTALKSSMAEWSRTYLWRFTTLADNPSIFQACVTSVESGRGHDIAGYTVITKRDMSWNIVGILRINGAITHETVSRQVSFADDCIHAIMDTYSQVLGFIGDYVGRVITDPQEPDKSSSVDHPAHYGGATNPFEVRKVVRAWTLGFWLGNAVKYIARAGKKDPSKYVEDLEKAIFYIQDEIDFYKQEQKNK